MSDVDCLIVGCGPAGAMLGLLLARAGASVLVLEKHADFFRDFRGDTIHPSTLEVLDQLGLADRFLSEVPHSTVPQFELRFDGDAAIEFNFQRLPSRFKFLALAPQWDFLEFVTNEARKYSGFALRMQAEVDDLLIENGRVVGVHSREPSGSSDIRAPLIVGTDGRTSRVRAAAGLRLVETSPLMDVLWFRLSRRPSDAESASLLSSPGYLIAALNRREYWQLGYVIRKGAYDEVRAAGLDAFRYSVAQLLPELADRTPEIADWDQVKLLSVRSDRLRRWYRDGLLCIGDAAHAMSPVAGVGINIAIQDAVEAANVLWRPLRSGIVRESDLARLQRRREIPVRLTQAFQSLVQELVLRPALSTESRAPIFGGNMRMVPHLPLVRDLPARIVGLGVSQARVRSPEINPKRLTERHQAAA